MIYPFYISVLWSLVEILIVIVPILLTVAFVTVAERKTMASLQRRLGPNLVGPYGLGQAFADALKLLLKEYISPTQSNIVLFFLGPIITLLFSLLGFYVIPFGPGLTIGDMKLGILYILAVSSLATYGILLAGWSANSKYAFLGSLRSTAQLISYELILSSAILLVILLSGSLSLTANIEAQKAVWYIYPLLPVFIIFFIGSIAESNRGPMDLAEAESELVSGFMTEHAAVIFVFFFLAEYASVVLLCIINTILFFGGYLLDMCYIYDMIFPILNLFIFAWDYLLGILYNDISNDYIWDMWNINDYCFTEESVYNPNNILSNSIIQGLFHGLVLGFKSCILIFIFIWVRASFPRIRFDQLMVFCWTVLLPLIIGLIVFYPCIFYALNNGFIFNSNINLL